MRWLPKYDKLHHKLLRLLVHLWSLPVTILIWVGYILPLWGSGQISYRGNVEYKWYPRVYMFSVNTTGSWYHRLWKNWAGWSGPFVFIVTRIDDQTPYRRKIAYKLKMHEYRHCQQWMLLGILFPIAYALSSLHIALFKRHLHAYFDNVFERDATQWEEINNFTGEGVISVHM